jgi:hypothetical protein
MLVLLIEEIYEIWRWNGLKWRDIFHGDLFSNLNNITALSATIWEADWRKL